MVTHKMSNQNKITKKDLIKGWVRYYATLEVSNSYERLTALAFLYGMMPILKIIYRDNDEELKEAYKRHLLFYNSEGSWGSLIFGITAALEEERGHLIESNADEEQIESSTEVINNLKIGLMGPLAGIGDTINHATLRPILLSLFIPLATAGSWLAGILPVTIWAIAISFLAYALNDRGYILGRNSIMDILKSGKIKQLINTASVLGLFMMGALSASYVRLNTVLEWTDSVGTTFSLQEMLDNLFPNLLPLIAVFSVYFYIQKRGPKYVRILVAIIVFSLVFSFFGVI